MRNRIDEYLHAYEQLGYFSGTVLVARNGEIILNEGYGLSNREHDVKNTSSTIYQLASISKMFTATAVMILQEQGLMDVARPIRYYLPEFPNGDRITGHHLLTHTSGLSKPIGLNAKMKIKLENVIQKFSDQPLAFNPGEKFQYVNSGYILLTYLIEKLSGQTYEDFLKQYIFLPSGMNNTGYDTDKRILKNRASGYSAFKNQIINGEFMDMSTHAGAAGLYSTAYDLYLWDQALNAGKLLNQDSLKRVFTPHQKTYGYGWYIDRQMIGGIQDSGHFMVVLAIADFLLVSRNSLKSACSL